MIKRETRKSFKLTVLLLGCLMFLGGLRARAQVRPSELQALKARSLGPAAPSGRMTSVAVVEKDPDIIYAGSATGGVWKSTDRGQTWNPIFDDQPASSVESIAIYQANPNIIWVATGEGNPRNSAGVGYGLYKSIDAGKTWESVGFEQSERFADIVLDPTSPDIAYAGVMGPTWSDSEERGVYKTMDGGDSWQKVLYVNERTGVSSLVMDPSNPNKLYAGLWSHRRTPYNFQSGGPGSGLYVSIDAGETWKRISSDAGLPKGDLGRIGIAAAPSNPDRVYALIEAKTNGLYRSEDGGESWKLINDSNEVDYRPFYFSKLAVNPQDDKSVYMIHGSLLVSRDGGKTIESHAGWGVHGDHHALWIDQDQPEYQIDANDGGLYFTRDGGESWDHVDNLPVSQFYNISVDNSLPYRVSGGLQDNGTWVGPSETWSRRGILNKDWVNVGGGDGFYAVIDPGNPDAGYSSWQAGHFNRFNLVTGQSKNIRPAPPEGVDKLRFNWNAAFALDPFNPKTIYVGSQFLHKSTDRGDHWEIISPDLTTNNPEWQHQMTSGGLTIDMTRAENYTTITEIAPSPVQRGVIWAGTDDGRVHVTRDGGESWSEVGDKVPGVPEHTWVSHLEASRHDAGTAFLVYDDHRRGNWKPYVYVTTDFGRHWKSIAPSGMHGFARTLLQDPVNPDLLYMGGEFGLYISPDGGKKWFPFKHGLPTTEYRALAFQERDNDLVIGTHGRGAYVIDNMGPLQALSAEPGIRGQALHLFDIPPAYEHEWGFTEGESSPGNAYFRGKNPPYGAVISYWISADSLEQHPEIEVLKEGEVIRTLKGSAEHGLNRVHWDFRNEGYRIPSYAGSNDSRRGFEVVPGSYTVRITSGEVVDSADVEVRQDPRLQVSMEDRRAKFAALQRGGKLMSTTAEALQRLNRTEQSVKSVLEILRQQDQPDSLAHAANRLKAGLVRMKERFIQGPTQDIIREPDNVNYELGQGLYALLSSFEAPTDAQLRYLRRGEEKLKKALGAMNDYYDSEVAGFRTMLQEAGFDVFPEYQPVSMPD